MKDKLLRLAFSLLQQLEESEDAVQDAMIKIWNMRSDWEGLNNIEGYAMVVLRNICIDKIRKNKYSIQELDSVQMVQTKDKNPFEFTSGKETHTRIQKAMQQLPEKQQLSIQLREMEGKTYNEIAELLEISIEQVKVNIFRARNAIKNELLKQDVAWNIVR